MRKQHPLLLLHPFFIACLLLLLLNDFILKATFHNWLTGKLSDVAGLAAFALFFTSTMPRHKGGVYIITALLFMWWKSPLAQPFIQLCHAAHLPFTRVVDYSDYLALLVLPVAWLCKPVIINSLHKKLATYSAGAISVFAFCATSLPYRFLPTSPTGIEGRRFVNTSITLQQVAKKLDSMGIQYTIDSFNVYPETSFNNYFRGYRNNMQYFYKRYDSAANTVVAANLPGVTQENLYRRYATTPYILIHNLAVDGEVIPSIKLVNSGNAMTESRYLQINEIELSQDAYNKFLNRQHKTRKYYENKIYRALLSKLQ